MVKRSHAPTHLFDHWTVIDDRLRHARRIVLFLDFDGTLVPIQSNREVFRLLEAQRVLTRITANRRVSVVAISGRRRADLRRLIGIAGIQYVGLYGSENGRLPVLAPSVKRTLAEARATFGTEILKYPGIDIENKVASFCVHFGQTEPQIKNRVRRRVRVLLGPYRHSLHLFENLRDIEIAPRSMEGKGAAVRKFLNLPKHRDSLPLYFGDDFSDESAFAELREEHGADSREGIAVLVGATRRTHAQYLLHNPAEVVTALSRIEESLK